MLAEPIRIQLGHESHYINVFFYSQQIKTAMLLFTAAKIIKGDTVRDCWELGYEDKQCEDIQDLSISTEESSFSGGKPSEATSVSQ